MVHKDKKLIVAQNKVISFAMLIPHIDFGILDKFNNAVKWKISLFFLLPKVIEKLLQVSSVRFLFFNISKFENKFSPIKGW